MALRFRRSIKIAPGLRFNINKKSASLRVGPRGLGYTISTTGKRTMSAGLPGTGLSYSDTINPKRSKPDDPPNLAVGLEEKQPSSVGKIALSLVVILLVASFCVPLIGSHNKSVKSSTSVEAESTISQPVVGGDIEQSTALVTTANVRLRQKPSTSSRTILTIQSGTNIISITTENGWHEVSHNGKIGWLYGDYLAARD